MKAQVWWPRTALIGLAAAGWGCAPSAGSAGVDASDGQAADAGRTSADAQAFDAETDSAVEPDAQAFDAETDAAVEPEAQASDAESDSTVSEPPLDATALDGSPIDARSEGDGEAAETLGPCGVAPPTGADASAVLVDLGMVGDILGVTQLGTRVLSSDGYPRWILWDALTGKQVATGLGPAWAAAGSVFLANDPAAGTDAEEIRSLADGSLIGTLPVSFASLATDGSYAWYADSKAITAWSLTGQVLFSHAGDYSTASGIMSGGTLGYQLPAVAVPTEVRIALGPAGNNVIEYFAVPSGAESVKPFSGSFQTWAFDGANFFTTASFLDASAYQTVHIYGPDATLLMTDVLTSTAYLAGMAGYYWTSTGTLVSTADPNYLGALGPMSYYFPNVGEQTVAWSSGTNTTGLTVETIRRFGGQVASAQVALPSAFGPNYPFSAGATSWTAGGVDGLLYSEPTGYLGCGRALAIAGSQAGTVAVSTATGQVLVFDSSSRTLLNRLSLASPFTALALSSAGTVLTGVDGVNAPQSAHADAYSVPALSPLASLQATSVSLASSGAVLGWVREVGGCSRGVTQLSDTNAGSSLFADTGRCPLPLPSPSGTYIAATDIAPSASSVTFVYQGLNFVGAVPGHAKGWIDDDQLLVQTYTNPNAPTVQPGATTYGLGTYGGTVIYDNQGNMLSAPPLPELDAFVPVSSGRIFWPLGQSIYDVSSGTLIAGPGSVTGIPSGITASFLVEALSSPFYWGVLLTPY